jgi:hypothetical protein
MFSGLLEAVGRCLGILTGRLIVQAGSAHVYEEWINFLPETSSSVWHFTDEVPREWFDLTVWSAEQVRTLQKGETPSGIEIVSLRS